MKVMVVGSGGREHALVWKLLRDPSVRGLVCCPGNAGISELARCLPIESGDANGLTLAAERESVDLVVFGPEEPLVKGAADWLRDRELAVFGPSQAASRLEGSKVFAKLFMERQAIPTATFGAFDNYGEAAEYLSRTTGRTVIKADGLAKGKGVMVCDNEMEAQAALRAVMVERRFGESGDRVVIEECLEGEEVSVMAVSDGKNHVLLPVSQDHKRALEGGQGPNTGGMGAYCPVPFVNDELLAVIDQKIIVPAISGMSEEGNPYNGVLYAGLMLTKQGPKVLEFNCRFGDPEAQAVLPAARIDLGETLLAAATGGLGSDRKCTIDCHAACVVLASGGYPGKYTTGHPIAGLETLKEREGVMAFHAGTESRGIRTLTAGGRVIGITGTGNSLDQALRRAYDAIGQIRFEGMHFRRDIGAKALGANL